MFAGKTTTLLRRIQAESNNGRIVAVIKSSKDTRYGLDSIVTHDGMKLPCWALANLSLFRQKIGTDAMISLMSSASMKLNSLKTFMTSAVRLLIMMAKQRRFGSVLDIIPIANSVMKLMARCEVCGKQAQFTLRKTDERETELIGGADVYMPVCRQHYVSGQVVIETARSVLGSQKLAYT
ncbi:hypothetical protein V6N11_076672 [Hibiscus sabdariffa]|uniref:Thymidine kinase n=1 Tax=Hibiscus sabdariffa TaxID=183260 RepID=A0ABR2A3D6_9ROSI